MYQISTFYFQATRRTSIFFSKTSLDIHSFIITSSIQFQNLDSMYLNALCNIYQLAAGFATFWYPGGSRNSRVALMPWHVFFGIYIYALAIATTATGLLEKATFLQTGNVISRYCNEALLVNCLGILIVALGGFVILGLVTPTHNKADDLRGNEWVIIYLKYENMKNCCKILLGCMDCCMNKLFNIYTQVSFSFQSWMFVLLLSINNLFVCFVHVCGLRKDLYFWHLQYRILYFLVNILKYLFSLWCIWRSSKGC